MSIERAIGKGLNVMAAAISKKSILEILQAVCSDQQVGKCPRALMSLFIRNRMNALTTTQCAPLFKDSDDCSQKLYQLVRQINSRYFAAFGIKIHRAVKDNVETWRIDTLSAG